MLATFLKIVCRFSASSESVLMGRAGADGLDFDERFIYDDGETARRVWTIQNNGVDEPRFGAAFGVRLILTVWPQADHKMFCPGSGDIVLSLSGQNLKVRFDDFIYRQMKIPRLALASKCS